MNRSHFLIAPGGAALVEYFFQAQLINVQKIQIGKVRKILHYINAISRYPLPNAIRFLCLFIPQLKANTGIPGQTCGRRF